MTGGGGSIPPEDEVYVRARALSLSCCPFTNITSEFTCGGGAPAREHLQVNRQTVDSAARIDHQTVNQVFDKSVDHKHTGSLLCCCLLFCASLGDRRSSVLFCGCAAVFCVCIVVLNFVVLVVDFCCFCGNLGQNKFVRTGQEPSSSSPLRTFDSPESNVIFAADICLIFMDRRSGDLMWNLL